MRGFTEIVEYQVTVDQSNGLSDLSLRVELNTNCPDAKTIVHRIQTSLHAAFNLRVPVNLAPAGTLPRFEMKASRWQVANSARP
jgi:phenylacetate-CoA ligase